MKGQGPKPETFWALDDVHFRVERGEVLGVIGRNGAGKSTLLKVLSRITEPTRGRVRIRGRVASLLEVGTGFHAELTGRENVYLNGSILGMSRQEIERNFDEIVEFAEVEKFIDMPVKRYSSGMYLRLAFAVAAHLEPEILIVDEVLAVGDSTFQNKCMGKMEQVAKQGRTVLFVSHNMASVRGLCSRCLWIHGGRLMQDGPPAEVVEEYLAYGAEITASVDLRDHPGRTRSSRTQMLQKISFLDETGASTANVAVGRPLTVALDIFTAEPLRRPRAILWITNSVGDRLFSLDSGFQAEVIPGIEGQGRVVCTIPELPVRPGRYTVHLAFGDYARFTEEIEYAANFEVTPDDFYGVGRLPPEKYGVYYQRGGWQ
jgi:lipopolysaccharide transport system ATP-binding protein